MTITTPRPASHRPVPSRPRRALLTGTVVFIDPDLPPDSPALGDLTRLGITARIYDDGLRALARLGTDRPEVIVISSRNNPGELRRIVELARAEYATPVLIALAPGDIESMVPTILAGARPTLDLPYRPDALLDELLNAWPAHQRPTALHVGDLALDPASYDARLGARGIDLSTLEFDLLHHLAQHVDHVVPRAQITQRLWPATADPENTLVAAVARLRRKLQPVGAERALHTVRGIGYRLDSQLLCTAQPAPHH